MRRIIETSGSVYALRYLTIVANKERPVKPPLRRILRKPEVLAASGYRPTQLDELINQGKFPAPIHLSEGGRALGWFEDEIIAHQVARAAERERQRKKA